MTIDTEAARILREYERRDATIPADFYSLAQPANYFAHSQLAHRLMLLKVRDRKIAEIGCGKGDWLTQFIQWGADPADLYGIDLSAARIAEALGIRSWRSSDAISRTRAVTS